PDPELCVPAVSHGEGFADGRGDEQRAGGDGRRLRYVRERLAAGGLPEQAHGGGAGRRRITGWQNAVNILDTIVEQKKLEVARLPKRRVTAQDLMVAVQARGGLRDFAAALHKP